MCIPLTFVFMTSVGSNESVGKNPAPYIECRIRNHRSQCQFKVYDILL